MAVRNTAPVPNFHFTQYPLTDALGSPSAGYLPLMDVDDPLTTWNRDELPDTVTSEHPILEWNNALASSTHCDSGDYTQHQHLSQQQQQQHGNAEGAMTPPPTREINYTAVDQHSSHPTSHNSPGGMTENTLANGVQPPTRSNPRPSIGGGMEFDASFARIRTCSILIFGRVKC